MLKPATLLFGRSYKITGACELELPAASLAERVAVAAVAVLFLPYTVIAFGVGAALLIFSSTHKRNFEMLQESDTISVIWKDGFPKICTARLTLRPIQEGDLPFYKELFNSPVAMAKYAGGVRDITNRFRGWLERWNEHPFSALAVLESKTNKVIGHVISGHGDYEGDLTKGWSEMAVVIDPNYWNSEFKNEATGNAGLKHIGSEAVRASVAYAKALSLSPGLVPSDVTAEQRDELEVQIRSNNKLRVHRNAQGQIDWVYLPFTELRATASKENAAGYQILERVFHRENGAEKKAKNAEIDLFTIKL